MSDRLTIRIDFDTKVRLRQIAANRGLSLSEAVRELVNREVGTDPLISVVDEMRRILAPLSGIDISQLIYHIARASIGPVAAVQIKDKETGDRLNESVKMAAEKISEKIIGENQHVC